MNMREYLLEYLAQESSEIIQAASKAKLYGMSSVYAGSSNQESIIRELNDLVGVVQLMQNMGFLPAEVLSQDRVEAKVSKILEQAEHSRRLGILTE